MNRLLAVLFGVVLAAAPLHAQTLFPAPSIASAPSGAAGGDLGGTFPNPSVAKINGNAYPAGVLADQVAVGQAANTLGFATLPDCHASNTALQYTKSSHDFGCGTGAGGATPLPYQTGWFDFNGVTPVTVALPAASKIYCIPVTARAAVNPSQFGIRVITGSANTHASVALYSAQYVSGTGTRPFNLLLSAATEFDTGTSNTSRAVNVTTATGYGGTLVPNTLYELCLWGDSTTPTISGTTVTSAPSQTAGTLTLINTPISSTSGFAGLGLTQTYTTGAVAWPTSFNGAEAWSEYTGGALPRALAYAP